MSEKLLTSDSRLRYYVFAYDANDKVAARSAFQDQRAASEYCIACVRFHGHTAARVYDIKTKQTIQRISHRD